MSIIIMILLLSFLVLVHEAGHFYAARALGIKVSKFGFGLPIGPTLWSKQVGDVEIVVHAFLLGGYVSFPDDEKDSNLPADSMDRFINRPVWQRMIVISAGVIANIITAFVLVLLTAFIQGKLPSGQYQVYVDNIAAEKSESVWSSGLQKGDKILKINGSDIESPYALTLYAKNSARFDGKVEEETVKTNFEKLTKLNPKLSADETIPQNTKVVLPVSQDENELHIDKEALKGYKLYHDSQVSLTSEQVKLRDSLKDQSVYMSEGNDTLSDLHGIVVITKIGGDVINNSGFFSGLLLTAMISLDLALVNFLPIPALDGGHFMFLVIEKLRGKPLDEETINKISSVFFLLLILFMVFVVFNDVYALIRHKF